MLANPLAFSCVLAVTHINDQQRPFYPVNGRAHHRRKFTIGDQHPGLAVIEDKGHGFGIQPGIDGIQYRAGHRHAEMCLVHFRGIGQHHGDRIVAAYTGLYQRRGQLAATAIGLAPGKTPGAVHHRKVVGIDTRRTLKKAHRRQCHMVRGVLVQTCTVGVCHR